MTDIRSNPDETDRDETDQLDWLAFRFISDELSEEETAAFETRLADDQLARESVARAVELTQLIAATAPAGGARATGESAIADALTAATPQAPGVTTTASPAWYRPLAWMAVGAAACLAIVVAGQLLPGGDEMARREGPAPLAVEPSQAPELARLWGRSWDQFQGDDLLNGLPSDEAAASGQPLAEVLPEYEPEDDLLEREEAPPIESPAWMLAAVAGLAEGMVD